MSEILNNCVMEAVLIHSPRHDELAVFYQQAFQWGDSKVYSNDHLGFSLENIYLGFERLADADVSAQGRTSLWFRVKHIESLIERLTDLGATLTHPMHYNEAEQESYAQFLDPEGNIIGLIQRH